MKTSHLFFFAFLLLGNTYLFSTDMDSSFSVKWKNDSWGSGGLFPAGPPWNMAGPYDFDNDGFGDFVVSSSYAGQYCNGAYHYCLLYTSPSPRDLSTSRMPSSA